jgi:hypothetical protein
MYKSDLIEIRDGVEADKAFIFATFLRSLYYDGGIFGEVPKDIFMLHYHAVIESLLSLPSAEVKVACLKDDNEVIVGYALLSAHGEILNYLYIKSAWRKIGLAKALAGSSVKSVTHLTKVGLSILKKQKGIIFNPFRFV